MSHILFPPFYYIKDKKVSFANISD
jgi:hypothetical protein